MTPHTWVTEKIDGGPVGVAEFYQCSVCGACGGIAFRKGSPKPFLAGPALPVSEDCEIAYEEISKHLETKEWKRQQLDSMQRRAEQLVTEMKRYYGVTLAKGKRGLVYGSFLDREGRAFQFESKENRTELHSVITWADGTVDDFREYGEAFDKVHEYYSALVLEELATAIRAELEPKEFTIHRAKTVHGSIVEPPADPTKPWETRYRRKFYVSKPGRYEVFIDRMYPTKPVTVLVDTLPEVFEVLSKEL
jgi:hypothetical protein